jgi:hypothetical protein
MKLINVIVVLMMFCCVFAKGSGGPDGFGYVWTDSDQTGGPSYSWVEISATGTALGLGDSQLSNKLSIGFSFEFYGHTYDSLRVSDNGFVTFTSDNAGIGYRQLPNTNQPTNVIAPLWKDFNPSSQGEVYYISDTANGRFIVQYEAVPIWGTSDLCTFQLLLYDDGRIVFQYKSLNGNFTFSSVGIQNQAGTVGTSIAWNSAYLKNLLAVELSAVKKGSFDVSASVLDFGTVQIGNNSVRSFTISNLSSSEYMEGTIESIPNYFITEAVKGIRTPKGKSTIPYKILQNGSKTYNILFNPPVKGLYEGDIVITSTDTDKPVNYISVSGTCLAPLINLAGTDTLQAASHFPEETQKQFTIFNDDLGNLNYSISVNFDSKKQSKGSGGPDSYGYSWVDSDEIEGPVYNWADISATGTALGLSEFDVSAPVSIGFDFDFYGNSYNTIMISSKGYMSFTDNTVDFEAVPIPSSSQPNNIIAPMWHDLDPGESSGDVYYYYDSPNQRFIVQYENILPYFEFAEESAYTFQTILYPSGEILFQYKKIGDYEYNDLYTIGIENSDGSGGLQVAHNNASYIKNELAVRISPQEKWLELSKNSGAIAGNGQDVITAFFDSSKLPLGRHTAEMVITSNDPVNPSVSIPVIYDVFEFTAPQSLTTSVSAGTLTLSWQAVPYATGYKIYSSNDPYGTFVLDTTGTFSGTTWYRAVSDSKKFYRVTAVDAK